MRQQLKIVGQIYKRNFFPLLGFACFHYGLFYVGLHVFYLLWGSVGGSFWQGVPLLMVGVRLLFLGVYVSFFILWEIAAYLLLYQVCYKSRLAAFMAMVAEGARQALGVCRLRNGMLLPYLLLVLPFQVVMTWSGLYLSVEIPHFILDFL